jgi:hypothetical protein
MSSMELAMRLAMRYRRTSPKFATCFLVSPEEDAMATTWALRSNNADITVADKCNAK